MFEVCMTKTVIVILFHCKYQNIIVELKLGVTLILMSYNLL